MSTETGMSSIVEQLNKELAIARLKVEKLEAAIKAASEVNSLETQGQIVTEHLGRGAKTAAIREYRANHPNAQPKEIVEALKLQGIEVTTGLVAAVKPASASSAASPRQHKGKLTEAILNALKGTAGLDLGQVVQKVIEGGYKSSGEKTKISQTVNQTLYNLIRGEVVKKDDEKKFHLKLQTN